MMNSAIRFRSRLSAGAIAGLLAGCAAQIQPETMAPVRPPQQSSAPLAQTDDFIVVRARAGDTYASLAATHLKDASLADIIAQANGAGPLQPGQLVIVPLRAANSSGVTIDGYQTIPVLCYHQFTAGRSTDRMIMPRTSFTQQMEYLKANNYHVISLAELEGFLNGSHLIPPRSVVITIDDGFRSGYDIAYPILKSYGFQATFFIYTDFVGARLGLGWAEINEMRASGVADIESHSKTHTTFSARPGEDEKSAAYAARLTGEIDTPQRVLERQTGGRIRVLAYPYGDTSREALKLLHDRNYSLALTVTRGANASFADPLLLRRDMIYGDASLADFQKSLRVYSRVNLK